MMIDIPSDCKQTRSLIDEKLKARSHGDCCRPDPLMPTSEPQVRNPCVRLWTLYDVVLQTLLNELVCPLEVVDVGSHWMQIEIRDTGTFTRTELPLNCLPPPRLSSRIHGYSTNSKKRERTRAVCISEAMAESTSPQQCYSMVHEPCISLLKTCMSAENASDVATHPSLSDSDYDFASQVRVEKVEPTSTISSRGAELDKLKTLAIIVEKKKQVLTQELEDVENVLQDEEKELKILERKFEEESAIEKAKEACFFQLPKNDFLEKGEKLQSTAERFSAFEMPQCESYASLLDKSTDSYTSMSAVAIESLRSTIAEKKKKLLQLCTIWADEDYEKLAKGNTAKLEKHSETLKGRHTDHMKRLRREHRTLQKNLVVVEKLAKEAEIACKALSVVMIIE
ncbi:uncharacterized protein LOC122262157 [Penaeus japonicus]|uniref:uncharacterized protein LOC122262157 n=1 Tax=Penaeus japonicus TaxID=27405 RepID=UPI001C716693|nr:uncharacterized protein LOC122262157 [Penaeus japonicus]